MQKTLLFVLLGLFPTMGSAIDLNCADLAEYQRIAGYVNWLNFVRILGIGALATGLLFIFWGVIKTILRLSGLMEVLLWLLIIGLLIGSYFVDPVYQPWTIAIGAILFPGGCLLSAHLHQIKLEKAQSLGILCLVWGLIALFYQSNFVGFLAVGALISSLGFSIAVTPFCYAFGFTSDDAVPRATTAGLMVMGLYIVLRIFHLESVETRMFASGALWLGSFVGFFGLLITSSPFCYGTKYWWPMNLLTVILLISAISIGMLFDIREVTTIGVTFMLFYLADKIIEIDTDGFIALGVKLFIAGGLIAGTWQLLRTNQDIVVRYLTL